MRVFRVLLFQMVCALSAFADPVDAAQREPIFQRYTRVCAALLSTVREQQPSAQMQAAQLELALQTLSGFQKHHLSSTSAIAARIEGIFQEFKASQQSAGDVTTKTFALQFRGSEEILDAHEERVKNGLAYLARESHWFEDWKLLNSGMILTAMMAYGVVINPSAIGITTFFFVGVADFVSPEIHDRDWTGRLSIGDLAKRLKRLVENREWSYRSWNVHFRRNVIQQILTSANSEKELRSDQISEPIINSYLTRFSMLLMGGRASLNQISRVDVDELLSVDPLTGEPLQTWILRVRLKRPKVSIKVLKKAEDGGVGVRRFARFNPLLGIDGKSEVF